MVEAEQWSQRVAAVEKASQKLCTERLGRLRRGFLFWGVMVGKQWWFYDVLWSFNGMFMGITEVQCDFIVI